MHNNKILKVISLIISTLKFVSIKLKECSNMKLNKKVQIL